MATDCRPTIDADADHQGRRVTLLDEFQPVFDVSDTVATLVSCFLVACAVSWSIGLPLLVTRLVIPS